ncbi:coatomer subunit delta [Salpingoeca rosetta]|uniref:Coatomer subunit delta n=1 Tax=Salpingoeca rosetta (strain ATCC 50818 / BSB-021) TaxID=946362 RepID=F2UL51_SALR5|nr:coatomer subunit delta [Salpingoeca rosetta]EGD77850.1 coatomer subunit delta [Salpingoeca rosetta]|eukprot:XP_004989914.1 coatomer subunit delta [Salpingoeca rosetta]
MVLLSAAVCTKAGKVVVSRQFMEMSRSRVEGLLAAFPKLMNSDDQHTFIETDTVRYVYQPMEQLYMVLITTKNSNILEDLETLRLFAKVVPEYCRSFTERDVAAHAFELIFAFDEIIALGYRENVDLYRIRTYTEMESHDEQIFKMRQKAKEREAKDIMKRKAKALQKERERGRGFGSTGMSGMGSASFMPQQDVAPVAPSVAAPSTPTQRSAPAKKPGRGMKLGGKSKGKDFVDALIQEGEEVAPDTADIIAPSKTQAAAPVATPNRESVHLAADEKITLEANRDGGLEHMEVKGTLTVFVSDPEVTRIRINCDKGPKSIPYQTHPNIDKRTFGGSGVIGLKDKERGFPVGTGVGVLKWRFQTTDDAHIPLSINCWPNPNADGSCDVNIDYELLADDLQLQDVTITVPLPAHSGAPVVARADGAYDHDSRNGVLLWRIPVVDSENPEGSIEFTTNGGDTDDFFPVQVDFASSKLYAGLQINSVEVIGGGDTTFSSEVSFAPASYEIV